MFDAALPATFGEFFEYQLAALLQGFAHLRGEVQVWLEPHGSGNVVKKCSFNRNGIYYVLTEERSVELFRHPQSVIKGCIRVFRTVEGKQNILNHVSLLKP